MSIAKLLTCAVLQAVANGDEKVLTELDSHGLLPAPGENANDFAKRLELLANALQALDKDLKKHKSFEVAPGIKISKSDAVSQAIKDEALVVNETLYDVRPDWVPGFFANESFGFLWGGCSLSDPESGLALFIIRKAFKQKRFWLFYDRRELLAHEMTHAAHQVFDEWQFEEYFAYQTANKPLRKIFGGCFIHKYDSLGFLLPILLLPVVQFLNILGLTALPMWIFWLLAAVYPIYLFCRTLRTNAIAAAARKFLQSLKVRKPDAVLFRMSVKEIRLLAKKQMPQGDDLRWKLLRKRLEDKEL